MRYKLTQKNILNTTYHNEKNFITEKRNRTVTYWFAHTLTSFHNINKKYMNTNKKNYEVKSCFNKIKPTSK